MILKHEFPLLHFSVLLVSNNLISICCDLSLSDLVIVDADTSFAQFDLLLTHQDVNHLIVSPKVHRYGCGCALADLSYPQFLRAQNFTSFIRLSDSIPQYIVPNSEEIALTNSLDT